MLFCVPLVTIMYIGVRDNDDAVHYDSFGDLFGFVSNRSLG